jgi:hypothetical protein
MKKPERQTYFFSQLSGNAEGKQPWAKIYIRFLFAFESIPFQPAVVKWVAQKSTARSAT